MSGDIHAEALERYERAAAAIRQGWVTRADLEREIPGVRPIYFSPFRNSLVIREGLALERRAAEERDRREWIEGVRRRLGLVAEVHRCRVAQSTCGPEWAWSCLRADCREWRVYYPSQPEAFASALAHARSFVPQPPESEPVTLVDMAVFTALQDDVRAEQDAFAAALPARMAEVAGDLNSTFADWLPEGMRFEWTTDGEQ